MIWCGFIVQKSPRNQLNDKLRDTKRFLYGEKCKNITLQMKNQIVKDLNKLLNSGIIDKALNESFRP